MTKNTKKRKRQQVQAIVRLLVMAAILVCVNMLAARFHYGLDLTAEKRFTLSPATKKMLGNMQDVAVVNVYLKGNFPAGFQRLRESTRERLQSFRDYAGGHIVFKFIDPFEGKNEDEKAAIYKQLGDKGILPVNLQVKETDEGYSQKIVFPWALVQYNGREMPVRLLENKMGMGPMEDLNYSETLLEYKFANAINKLSFPAKPDVAYIMGHGETLGINTFDILTALQKQYNIDTIDLVSSIKIPPHYAAIIINKPKLPFDDKDKFKIDQYIMNGGHVLWALDMLRTSMDSLQRSEQFITTDYGLNLEDQLFKYGIRINNDLVEEYQQCLPIPVTVGMVGNNPDIQLRPWMYFPVFEPVAGHPIVKNMDYVMGRFVSSIDTTTNAIQKTILLQSSKYSRVEPSPARVSLSILKYPLDPRMFNSPEHTTAILLEGKFRSVFENRLHPDFLRVLRDSLKTVFKPVADSNTAMIVVSDGDIMENDFSSSMGPMETGYWQFSKQHFANKEFILNCLEYLTDHSGLIEARSKDVRLRQLDPGRLKEEKMKWRIINIGLPIALVFIFASAYIFFRKRRYEVKA